MKVNKQKIGKEAVLTSYLHDVSCLTELSNAVHRPAILIFPGGGYMMCSDREGEPVALAYLSEGYNVFVLNYSVGSPDVFSNALVDAENALEYIMLNAGELNIQKDKIAVVGFSAGGHLAASLGTIGRIHPSALILGYPCIKADIGKTLGITIPGVEKSVTKNTPPTFLFSTANDRTVPVSNSLAFAQALDDAGIPFELHIFQQGEHGLALAKPMTSNGFSNMVNESVATWFLTSIAWLKQNWGDFETTRRDGGSIAIETNSAAMKMPLQEVLENHEMKIVIEQFIPELNVLLKANPVAKQLSLLQIAGYGSSLLSEEIIFQIDREFMKKEC